MAAIHSPVEAVHSSNEDMDPLMPHSIGESCLPGASPSDQLKIGFFKTDRATQTDVSDILELKELSTAVETLVKEIMILKNRVESNILILEADYQMKLEEQCTHLYQRMNDHNSYLKNKYLQRIEVLRNSFRQQLANAIAKINAECTIPQFSDLNIIKAVWDYTEKWKQARKLKCAEEPWQVFQDAWNNLPADILIILHDSVLKRTDAVLKAKDSHAKYVYCLQLFIKYCTELSKKNKTTHEDSITTLSALKQKDLLISSLKERLEEYENSRQTDMINFDLKNEFEKEKLIEENQGLKEQINSLVQDAENMSKTIILKEMQIDELGNTSRLNSRGKAMKVKGSAQDSELVALKEKSENTEQKMQKLFQSEEYLKKALQNEKLKGKQMLELQKLQMEKMLHVTLLKMEESEQASRELSESLKEKETQLIHQMEIASLLKQVPIVEKEAHPVEETEPVNSDEIIEELKSLRKKDREQRKIIEDLNKQRDRSNRIWEKKFAILKQSYHAIKDEMYLRCSLQRQAPSLHCAFTHNIIGEFPWIDFRAKNNFSPYFPLPQIGSQSAPQTAQREHKMDRAPSAPEAVNLR
ncbi:uncharacterized protein C10orf67 homolog, mitochondrial [Mobula hypostoma]|uniref:uncharacterized protein C10orf67 homolog, mitochondrial n=1 Tax=Mobula hypostoma TaxID=723540 RepID=UPI002FC2EF1E